MRWVGLLMGLAAFPAFAETVEERQDRQCRMGWEELTSIPEQFPVTGAYQGLVDGWCRFTDIGFVTEGYTPDLQINEVLLRGEAFGRFLLDEVQTGPVMRLDVQVDGLRMVPQVDQPQMDWLFRAQGQAFGISADMALNWDAVTKVVNLSQLDVDFPGDNAVSMTGSVAQVDLTSDATMQMSAAGFAITEVALDVTTHGMFETYALIVLGAALLPTEGDMDAAVEALRAEALGGIAALPDAAFPAGTKGALSALVGELPNPAGRLTVDFSATPGFGPARLTGFAMSGVPTTVAEAASLFQGIAVDATWTHEESPD